MAFDRMNVLQNNKFSKISISDAAVGAVVWTRKEPTLCGWSALGVSGFVSGAYLFCLFSTLA
jgi:hypothetical protein